MEQRLHQRQRAGRPLVAEDGLTPAAAGMQPDMAFKGETGTAFKSQEYSVMRSRWSDPRSAFIAAKAGEIFTYHGHYDIGTFTLDALGKRWFHDLGKELYAIEASAPRADIYRYRAEGHNTLVIDPANGPGITNPSFSPLVSFQSKSSGAGAFSIHDLTPVHSGMSRVWRGMRMIGGRDEMLLQDEIQATTGKNVWWFAHYTHPTTTATLDPDGTSVTLTQGSERLWCKIVSGGGTFQIMDACPSPPRRIPSIQIANSGLQETRHQSHQRHQHHPRRLVRPAGSRRGRPLHPADDPTPGELADRPRQLSAGRHRQLRIQRQQPTRGRRSLAACRR